jgi:hypothetical protein
LSRECYDDVGVIFGLFGNESIEAHFLDQARVSAYPRNIQRSLNRAQAGIEFAKRQ